MTLARLIEAVERGEWPGQINGIAREVFPYNEDWRKDHGVMAHEAFDGSLDAAKRLHDALLSGWTVDDMGQRAGGWRVQLGRFDGKTPRPAPSAMIEGNPARAWLLAILRAMEGREK